MDQEDYGLMLLGVSCFTDNSSASSRSIFFTDVRRELVWIKQSSGGFVLPETPYYEINSTSGSLLKSAGQR